MLQGNATNDSVYLVATIPPPPGASDAYSAVTRIQQAPLADMAALLRCGEAEEEGIASEAAPLLLVSGPVRQADNDHGAPLLPSFGTAREWLVVAGLAVVGASAVFAISIAF